MEECRKFTPDDFQIDTMDVAQTSKSRLRLAKYLNSATAPIKNNTNKNKFKEDIVLMKSVMMHKVMDGLINSEHLANEKKYLWELTCAGVPHINKLFGTVRSAEEIFFVLELLPGATLDKHFRTNPFTEERTKHYTAELVTIISNLHERGFIYRDLKAPNVILSAGRIKLCDFGFINKVNADGRCFSLCGTPHALAPEVSLQNQEKTGCGYTNTIDWFALGVLVYEMLTQEAPFGYTGDLRAKCAEGVENNEGLWNYENVSEDAERFIKACLKTNPEERIGKGGVKELWEHPFLKGWEDVYDRPSPPYNKNADEKHGVFLEDFAQKPDKNGAAEDPWADF
jgi:serine/threonine protein kinase